MRHVMRHAIHSLRAVALALAVAPAAAGAQRALPRGIRLRLTLADGSHPTGYVVSADSAIVRLSARRDAADVWRTVPAPLVVAYQHPAGRDRWRGVRRGAAVGGVLGVAVIGLGLYGDAHAGDIILPSYVFTVPLATALTIVGSGVGAIAAPTRWGTPRSRVARATIAAPPGAARGASAVGIPSLLDSSGGERETASDDRR